MCQYKCGCPLSVCSDAGGTYHHCVRNQSIPTLPLDPTHLKPGLRLAVGVSGGADSVALLRALHEQSRELGLVLHVAHLHHGLRGEEADADQLFVQQLAEKLALPFHTARVDTAAEAAVQPSKPAETIEEAARRLRYAYFRELMSTHTIDAVATAHTLDDQAETVLAKFLRGAWTEGLSGIHPIVQFPEGPILRPLLAVPRAEIERYLHALGQRWREDSTNRATTFTRNRIRHELLPQLETWNPSLRRHLAQMASLAREEESLLAAEAARITAQITLPGRPVRGGGRAASEGIALDIAQLAAQPIALQRRILRHAAAQLATAPDFPATESLRNLALTGHVGQKLELASSLRAGRSHRELRLTIAPPAKSADASAPAPVAIPIPGAISSQTYGLRVEIRGEGPAATLRHWKPGDRILLKHSSNPKKVKEVLERMKITGPDRAIWPVIERQGQILWMRGVQVEPIPGLAITVHPL